MYICGCEPLGAFNELAFTGDSMREPIQGEANGCRQFSLLPKRAYCGTFVANDATSSASPMSTIMQQTKTAANATLNQTGLQCEVGIQNAWRFLLLCFRLPRYPLHTVCPLRKLIKLCGPQQTKYCHKDTKTHKFYFLLSLFFWNIKCSYVFNKL